MISNLQDKKIIIGVCGSIAAYKSVYLVRALVKLGAEVRVVMTRSAADFVTPLTFSTLSKNPVVHDLTDGDQWNNHVELAMWADLMVIAPATATTLSKMATGNADNLLLAIYLSAKCPICIAPAMDLDMWKHPATKKNIQILASFGHEIIPVGSGELASGLHGDGRMAEPDEIVDFISDFLAGDTIWKGKTVLITAGPTHEYIDPVRFIGNASSGKMGIELADVFAHQGANVILVLGPSGLSPSSGSVRVIRVVSADDMYQACLSHHTSADVCIFAAAVADYKPKVQNETKIKKKDDSFSFEMVKNQDIAASLGKVKKPGQVHVGFALETHNELTFAKNKLVEKNFDLIVLNSLKDEGAGFQVDTNKVTILDAKGNMESFPLKSKKEVAEDILKKVKESLSSK